MDVDALLQKHTLVELKDVERKFRTDVERRKEELRDLVSRRYRDLLDAADQIKGMHVAISNVTEQLELCRSVAESSLTRRTHHSHFSLSTLANQSINQRAAPTSDVILDRLLRETPEMIFQALDRGNPLRASLLYAFTRNLVWQRNADPASAVAKAEEDTRWTFLRAYSAFILQSIQTQFEKVSYESRELSGYFAATAVLDSRSTRLDILQTFLAVRGKVLHELLTTSSTLSTKEVVRLLLICVLETFRGVHEIFILYYAVGERLREEAVAVAKEIFS